MHRVASDAPEVLVGNNSRIDISINSIICIIISTIIIIIIIIIFIIIIIIIICFAIDGVRLRLRDGLMMIIMIDISDVM